MKVKKGIILTGITVLLVTVLSTFSNVQAATNNKYFNIKMLRNSGYGYKLANSQKNVWKIYEDGGNMDDTIYCLRGGPGFSSTDMADATPTRTLYSRYFNMKDPDSISSTYLSALPDTNSIEYKRLLWVLDNCYVAPKTNASSSDREASAQNRQMLLDAAARYAKEVGNPDVTEYELEMLTDDDIDAVQQLAVWYYTNPSGDYHVTSSFEFWLNSVQNIDGTYQPLSDDFYFDDGNQRAYACQALFAYLVETPQKSGFSYIISSSQSTSSPVEIENTNVTIETANGRLVVGPYRINQLRNIDYSLNGEFIDGNGNIINDIIYLDKDKYQVATGTTIRDLVDEDFYIAIPITTNTTNIEFNIDGTFFSTITNYWSVENPGNTDQPIVIIEKVKNTFSDSTNSENNPENPDNPEFDLALRKFITTVTNSEKDKTNSYDRAPLVDVSPLLSGEKNKTTAIYKHTKEPIVVSKGDIVTYTIRIYNEGGIDGYATQITDYLPSGLKFLSDSTINKNYGWTNPSGDGKTIVTRYLQDQLLTALDGNNIKYKDVQVECEVTATSGENDQHLKNIAEITEHKDVNGNTNIIDRDSQPNNVNLDNYGNISQQDDDDFEDLVLLGQYFDLALRKFITTVTDSERNKTNSYDRAPSVDVSPLLSGEKNKTTAIYKHTKEPIVVSKGDIVTYTIRIYNEGQLDGYATQITDHLPSGLKFLSDSTINKNYGWTNPSGDGKTIVTRYLQDQLLTALDGTNIQYKDVQVECEVTATSGENNQHLKNIAEITEHKDVNGNTNIIDRDSQPNNVNLDNYGNISQQDDDDFEDLVLLGQYFDLSLRKFITTVTDSEKDKTNSYDRAPLVDISPLLSGNKDKTTAIYNHPKTPVSVSDGNIVTYTIRVYNEGQLDGYVNEITDHLPSQLEFIVNDELNAKYAWTVSSDGRTVKTTITSPDTANSASRDTIYADRKTESDKVLLKAFDGKTLDYIDVQIRCKVKDNINLYEKITNIAEISKFTDSNKNTVTDRDSQADNVTLPSDETLPNYKDTEINRGDKYIPGQQDDDDFEKLVLQRFDLALKKFITGVISGENKTDITNRAPVFKKVNDKEYKYEHTKEPVEVANGNTVIYTLRIFNEGNVAGYATEVKDNLPEGLEFLPENETNTKYRWKMYKEDGTETTKVSEAKYIKTDYLSKTQEKASGDNLIKAFDPETMTMPDYKDVQVAFKVTEPNTSDRIIINTAEIAEDTDKEGNPIDDIDSTPNNDKEEEDDIDIEKVKVKFFDLSLRKWVTESIVTYDGKTTVTKTGHTAEDDPEIPAKVEIRGSRISKTTVKFKFSIKVTNEGEIAGYAKQLIDYVPEGLKYIQADNPKWKEADGKIVTDQLKDTLLEPGESATVEIILTWINNKNNLGLKTNWAEIYEDYNEHYSPDIDSTPGNNIKGEDDIDEAPVILSVVTGSVPAYVTLAIASISIIAGGIVLIKKFVI